LEAEAACRNEGCKLVFDNPMVSCVVIGFGKAGRKAVQVYEFTGASW